MSNVEVRTVSLIEVRSRIGRGILVDPVRIVTEWFTLEGERVACVDPTVEAELNEMNLDHDNTGVVVTVEFLRAARASLPKGSAT